MADSSVRLCVSGAGRRCRSLLISLRVLAKHSYYILSPNARKSSRKEKMKLYNSAKAPKAVKRKISLSFYLQQIDDLKVWNCQAILHWRTMSRHLESSAPLFVPADTCQLHAYQCAGDLLGPQRLWLQTSGQLNADLITR